jgi:hypothetical protein
MRRVGTLLADARGLIWAATAAVLALSVVSVEAQAPPRATQISYDRDQARDIINDLQGLGFEDERLMRTLPGRMPMPNPQTPTPEMRALRPLIRDFADESSQLGYLLNDEIRRIPSIRSLLTSALNISGMAVNLDKQAARFNDHRMLQQEFQQLDAAWRELAYRLESVRGLRKEIRDSVANLNDLDEQIRDSIDMRPQVNRRQLWQKTNDLAVDLQNLIDDVRMELTGAEARQFQASLTRSRSQVTSLASMFEDTTADMDEIVYAYKQFQTGWYPQRAKLQEFDNRYFERSLRRITQTDGEIHRLLLLPNKIDSRQLLYLTSALRKDIDEFFDRLSLKLLIHLPRAERVPGVASEFYGVCEHFIDEVENDAEYDELVDSFRYIEQAERSFADVFKDIESDDALAALQQISQTIGTLRSAMQVQSDTFDRRAAIEYAASVESYTDQLEWVAKRWLAKERPPYANSCLNSIAQMRDGIAELHQDLVAGGSPSEFRRQVESVYNTWRTVYGHLVKCQTDDRPNLGRLSSKITPSLVELRTMLTQ